jgi:hypothetical protein
MKAVKSSLSKSTAAVTAALTREQFWREHLQQWSQSGLSQSAYCRREGLTLHRFGYWRRKRPAAAKPAPVRGGFVPVRVMPSMVEGSLTVRLANGVEVRGITSENVELIGRLLSHL